MSVELLEKQVHCWKKDCSWGLETPILWLSMSWSCAVGVFYVKFEEKNQIQMSSEGPRTVLVGCILPSQPSILDDDSNVRNRGCRWPHIPGKCNWYVTRFYFFSVVKAPMNWGLCRLSAGQTEPHALGGKPDLLHWLVGGSGGSLGVGLTLLTLLIYI